MQSSCDYAKRVLDKMCCLILLLLTAEVHAQTIIFVPAATGTGISLVLPARFGINLDDSVNYGNGQLTANLLASDAASFSPQIWQQSSQCGASTTDSWTDTNRYSPQPANFLRGATYQVISGPNKGASGRILSSTAAGASGVIYRLSGKLQAPCISGGNSDEMILRCRTPLSSCVGGYTPAQLAGINITEVGGGRVAFETSDVSPSSSSLQALQLTAPANGGNAGVTANFDAVLFAKSFINLNGTYTLTFRAKGTSGEPTLSYSVYRAGRDEYLLGKMTPVITPNAGEGWTNYSFSFTASETGSHDATGQVRLDASNGTVLLQDIALTEAPTGGNTTVFRNAVYQRLLALHPGLLRMMTDSSWGCTPENMMQPTLSGRLLCGFNSYKQYGEPISYGWSDFLDLVHKVGATDAWITFSVYATPADMANIAAYLSGKCGNGNVYTAMRCNYGQTVPWTSVFNHIYLEMGNEIWNSPNGINAYGNGGLNYGSLVAENVAALRASSFYRNNMKFVASGFILQSNSIYGWNATVLTAAGKHLPDYIDGAPYMFQDMTDLDSTRDIFGAMFAEPVNYVSSTYAVGKGYTYGLDHFTATHFPGVQGAVYETNLGTNCALKGTTQGQIDQVVAGVGAGLDATLAMLLAARDAGITVQNFFALPEYANKFGLATSITSGSCPLIDTYIPYQPLWGANLFMPGPSPAYNIDRPSGILLQGINNAIGTKYDLLATVQTGTLTYDQPASQPNPTAYPVAGANSIAANPAVPLVQAFGFGDGAGNYALIVYNLNLNHSEAISFSGAAAPAGAVTKTVFTSAHVTDNNERLGIGRTPNVNYPPSTILSSPKGDGLPPFSMTTYTWSLGSTNAEVKPASVR